MIQNTFQFVQLFDGDGLIVTHADVAQHVEVYSFKLLQELKSVWKALVASLSWGQEDVLLDAAQTLASVWRMWQLPVTVCPFHSAELCCLWRLSLPSSERDIHQTERAPAPDLCAVYTTHNPPDTLISLGAPHS